MGLSIGGGQDLFKVGQPQGIGQDGQQGVQQQGDNDLVTKLLQAALSGNDKSSGSSGGCGKSGGSSGGCGGGGGCGKSSGSDDSSNNLLQMLAALMQSQGQNGQQGLNDGSAAGGEANQTNPLKLLG